MKTIKELVDIIKDELLDEVLRRETCARKCIQQATAQAEREEIEAYAKKLEHIKESEKLSSFEEEYLKAYAVLTLVEKIVCKNVNGETIQ